MKTRIPSPHRTSTLAKDWMARGGGSVYRSGLLPNEPRIANLPQAQALSDRFLTPALADIEALLLHLRATLDPVLSARQPLKAGKPYPLGQCLEISQAVEQRLKALRRSEVPAHLAAGFEALQQYKQHGGTIRLVWGDLRGQYFQNAFLVGLYYMDVSNDTVFVTKPKVEILPLQDANFHRIEDYAHFSRVAKNYWKVALYPNHVLPELAPFCPLVAVYPSGMIELLDSSGYMAMLNVRSRFAHAEAVLQEPPMNPSLGALMVQALEGFEGIGRCARMDQGREAALRCCALLRGLRQSALEKRYDAAYRQVWSVNAHLARFRVEHAPAEASVSEPASAPTPGSGLESGSGSRSGSGSLNTVEPLSPLPAALRSTDALAALLRQAAGQSR